MAYKNYSTSYDTQPENEGNESARKWVMHHEQSWRWGLDMSEFTMRHVKVISLPDSLIHFELGNYNLHGNTEMRQYLSVTNR